MLADPGAEFAMPLIRSKSVPNNREACFIQRNESVTFRSLGVVMKELTKSNPGIDPTEPYFVELTAPSHG